MIIITIKELVNNLPLILEYFVPGFIFAIVYQFLTSKNFKNVGFITIACIVSSVIIKNILATLHLYIFPSVVFSNEAKVIITCIFAILISIGCAKISELKIVNKGFSLLSHKSIYNDVWRDVIDYKLGTTLIIYSKNEMIIGKLWVHEEKGLDSWFVLRDYIIVNMETNETLESDSFEESKSTIAINLKNIEKIEIHYNNKTNIFD